MSQSFSTDLVPLSDRLDAWRWNATQICGDSRFTFPNRRVFHGSIERRTLNGLEFTRFASSSVSFAKFPTKIHLSDNPYIIVTQLEGFRTYCQGGGAASLRPGDTTLIDSGRPWSSECAMDCSRMYLRLPRWLLENRLHLKSLPIARCISGTSGLGAALAPLAMSLYEQAALLEPAEASVAIDAYLGLLSACLGHSELLPSDHKTARDLLPAVDGLVERNLADPALSPAKIASELGISVRHLHRLFNTSGRSLSGWIRERRLQQCCADLADPRMR